MNLQDSFLNQVRMQKIPVNIYLTSGYQMKGNITGFDPFIILLDSAGKQSVVYKHAVSTIIPLRAVSFFRARDEEQDETEDQPAEGVEENGQME